MTAPDLFTYLDHRLFLADWFAWRKSENHRFSHRMFARLSGQRSPSLLLQVMQGKRNLTPQTTQSFCNAMHLDGEECEFFGLLVELDRARTVEERNEVWSRISATRRFQQARRIEGEAVRYLSHWYFPAIRELATCPGFQDDPAWVARVLRPRITLPQAREALATLTALGLLAPGPAGKLVAGDATVVTPHEVAGLAAHNYHRGMLQRATDGIEAFPPAQRHLGSVTVSIPPSLIPRIKREIAGFQERLLDLCDSAEGDHTQVVQIGLQLVPLSVAIDGEDA